MPSIHVRNIGPISDSGAIPLTPVMLLIGKQSTGKSTMLKIMSFCSWIEKRIMVDGEKLISKYTHYGRFIREIKSFHHFSDTFFRETSYIDYEGDCIHIEWEGDKSNAKITRKSNYHSDRHNTKISFIPSERNMVSAIQNINKAYKSSDYDALYNYIWEFDEAKGSHDREHPIAFPFDHNLAYYYDEKSDKDMVLMRNQRRSFETFYASSGIQSALPIIVIVDYTTSIIGAERKISQKDISNAVARLVLDANNGISDLSKVDLSSAFQLLLYKNAQFYIEEPEQNLFPSSQYEMVKSIVKSIKRATVATGSNSRVVMTTHSPYILTSLNFLMKAAVALKERPAEATKLINADEILPAEYYSAYWITNNGTLESIVDKEYGFIMGDKLDEISEILSEQTELLNDIIYGDSL